MNDPAIIAIVGAAAGLIILSILKRLFGPGRRRRELQRTVRKTRAALEQRRAEAAELAGAIEATSSKDVIAGYAIERQIEAVFTDGHTGPGEAVEALKIVAAVKGANAIINLQSVRSPGGKCMAYGDAVAVRPTKGGVEADGGLPPLPELEEEG